MTGVVGTVTKDSDDNCIGVWHSWCVQFDNTEFLPSKLKGWDTWWIGKGKLELV